MTGEDDAFDVVVIGAGPAGSAAAALLARAGRRVALLEKRPFPRYRVGESLIPYCWFPLQRLGLIEKLDRSAFIVRKHSVQFVSTQGQRSAPFYFHEHTDHDCARTWQVVRSDFDQMLLDNAVEEGVEFHAETAATELRREEGRVVGVRATGPEGPARDLRATITIDATGREAFSQVSNQWRVNDPVLQKIAIWTYYQGGLRDPGIDEGATTIAYLPEKGWFWYIPLSGDKVSVGVVAGRDYLFRGDRDPEAIFHREVAAQPWIEEHLRPGCPMEPCRITSDFSYRSRHCAEDGLVLTGDAFAFLDPVFSSGVLLALQSGVMVADATEAALAAGDPSAGRFRAYGEELCAGMESMRRLVYAFYDTEFNFADLLQAHPDLREDLTDCLIGNLSRDYTRLFDAVREFGTVPEPLPHGGPQTG